MSAPTPSNRLPPAVLRIELPPLTPEQADAIFDLLSSLETAFFEAHEEPLVALWTANGALLGSKAEPPDDGADASVPDDDDIPF